MDALYLLSYESNGSPNRARTCDNSINSRVLYQLSYQGIVTISSKHIPQLPEVRMFAWRRPTLPGPCGPSTIGAGGLNGRVRDGYVWNPSAIATKRAFVKQMRSALVLVHHYKVCIKPIAFYKDLLPEN